MGNREFSRVFKLENGQVSPVLRKSWQTEEERKTRGIKKKRSGWEAAKVVDKSGAE